HGWRMTKFELVRTAGRWRPRSRTYVALAILFVTACSTNAKDLRCTSLAKVISRSGAIDGDHWLMSDISLGSSSKFHQNDYLSALGMKRGVASPDIANVLATTSAAEMATPAKCRGT